MKTRIAIGLAAVLAAGAPVFGDLDALAAKGTKSKKGAASTQSVPTQPETPSTQVAQPAKYDTKSGPAWQMLSGKLTKIEGDFYLVQDFEGDVHRVHVGTDTKRLNGNKKPGDSIRAEITRGYHANSIQ